MTYEEFLDKYKLDKNDRINSFELAAFFAVMDVLYLEYTPEQILEMIKDFCENADDIYNSINDACAKLAKELQGTYKLGDETGNFKVFDIKNDKYDA